jgi:hypothetical protein
MCRYRDALNEIFQLDVFHVKPVLLMKTGLDDFSVDEKS